MEKWERDICSLRTMAEKYPQESYATEACAVQLEWIFLKRTKKVTVQAFAGLEKYAGNRFDLSFLWKIYTPPPIVGALSMFPVNKSGLGLKNPVTSEKEKYNSLLREICEQIGAV